MSFGQFCERTLTILKANYKIDPFDNPQLTARQASIRETAFNKMFYGYTAENREDNPDWVGRVQSTALSISQELEA